jgi:hypothetical protein
LEDSLTKTIEILSLARHTYALPNESSDAKFPTVGAVYDRPYFVESRKNGRS